MSTDRHTDRQHIHTDRHTHTHRHTDNMPKMTFLDPVTFKTWKSIINLEVGFLDQCNTFSIEKVKEKKDKNNKKNKTKSQTQLKTISFGKIFSGGK